MRRIDECALLPIGPAEQGARMVGDGAIPACLQRRLQPIRRGRPVAAQTVNHAEKMMAVGLPALGRGHDAGRIPGGM